MNKTSRARGGGEIYNKTSRNFCGHVDFSEMNGGGGGGIIIKRGIVISLYSSKITTSNVVIFLKL